MRLPDYTTSPLSFQRLCLIVGCQCVEDLLNVSIEHLLQPVEGEPDSVVRHPTLREIIGADPLASLPGPDLTPSLLRNFQSLLLLSLIQHPCPEDLHRLGLILVL